MESAGFPAQLTFITELFSNIRLRQDFVTSIVDKLQLWTGCHCVGIRIVDPDNFMPYAAHVGFPQAFCDHENWLSLREDQCACTRIVNNKTLPVDQPLLTENGSILSNDLQAFGAGLSAAEAGFFRGQCYECGFGTLALVPIRRKAEIIGLIHLAGMSTDQLPPAMIRTLEALTAPIAEVIERLSTEDRLRNKQLEMEQFVYSVSHDLKSPLITIRTFLAMLQQDLLHKEQQKINEDIDYIDKSAVKIERLLDALLQYSRIGKKDAPAQTIPLAQRVDDCLTSLAGPLKNHKIQITTRGLTQQLQGDPLHFERIWQNLIENAVKYRGDQDQPEIEIGALQQAGDVVFYVRDNGIGIAPEHSERIFNLFSQLNSGSEGSGLGLALVKKIVAIYQGRVWVESAGEGQGSCFKFTLPGAMIPERTTDEL
mgnify:CR=1 FL=1